MEHLTPIAMDALGKNHKLRIVSSEQLKTELEAKDQALTYRSMAEVVCLHQALPLHRIESSKRLEAMFPTGLAHASTGRLAA